MNCPTHEILDWLLAGNLAGTALDGVEKHVEHCAECQRHLEAITACDTSFGVDSARLNDGEDGHADQAPRELSFLGDALQAVIGQVGEGTPSLNAAGLQRLAVDGNEFETRIETSEIDLKSGSLAIPGYRVERELGRGGTGVVYFAHDIRLNRPVAIKIVDMRQLADPVRIKRFRAEALATARLTHPNIVEVHDVGEAGGLAYIVLEYAEQGSLRDEIAEKPLIGTAAAQLVETISRAIAYAHSQGFVHRDLKPANILRTTDGTWKVSDFGLAKELDVDTGWTRTGDVVGTPNYMAPEQLTGNSEDVGPTTDVFALGAILYKILTGMTPFAGDTTVQTLLHLRDCAPTRPTVLNASLSRDLEAICLKCLEKHPSKRYQSADELADELARFQRREPIQTRSRSIVDTLLRWRSRHQRAGFAILAIIVIGPLASILLAKNLYDRETQQFAEDFSSLAESRAAAITAELATQFDLLFQLRSFFETNRKPTFAKFKAFASVIKDRHPAVAALEWAPHVDGSDRDAHELAARDVIENAETASGVAGYTIRWQDGLGNLKPAGESEVYYPVLFAVPLEENLQAIGFDLASNKRRLSALIAASESDDVVITPPIELVQDESPDASVLAILPVSRKFLGESDSSDLADIKGYVVGVYRVREIVQAACAPFQNTVPMRLSEATDSEQAVLFDSTSLAADQVAIQEARQLIVGNRKWIFTLSSDASFVESRRTNEPYLVAVCGLALSVMIALSLFAVTTDSSS